MIITEKDKEKRVEKILSSLFDNEICLPFNFEQNDPIYNWVIENIGDRRVKHPYFSAINGFMDFQEGVWAWIIRGEYECWWFQRTNDLIKFRLMFGGTLSKDLREKYWKI